MLLHMILSIVLAAAAQGVEGTGHPVPEYWKGLHSCITGPDWPCMDCERYLPGTCNHYDFDGDEDVDLRDFAILAVMVSEAAR